MVFYSYITVSDENAVKLASKPKEFLDTIVDVNEFFANNVSFIKSVYEPKAFNREQTTKNLEKAVWFDSIKDKWTKKQIEDEINKDMLLSKYQKEKGKLVINEVFKNHLKNKVSEFSQCVYDYVQRHGDEKGVHVSCQFDPYLFNVPHYDWNQDNSRYYKFESYEKDLKKFKNMADRNVPSFKIFQASLREEP